MALVILRQVSESCFAALNARRRGGSSSAGWRRSTLEADRPGTVRRVARPGTTPRERRAGLPGAAQRARRCAVGHGKNLRRDLRCGEGAWHRGGVL